MASPIYEVKKAKLGKSIAGEDLPNAARNRAHRGYIEVHADAPWQPRATLSGPWAAIVVPV
jgi:hypothetical protein